MTTTTFEVPVRHGFLCARRFGTQGPLAICIPGLSANSRSFDAIAGALDQAVAVDLRGRGRSTKSPPGTYGWDAHARDVLELAEAMGARTFDLVGHSMGAHVALALVHRWAHRVRRLVLIDSISPPPPPAMEPVRTAVAQLDKEHPSIDAYLELVKRIGTIEPWSDLWEGTFRYDLDISPNGVRRRTSRDAVMEDLVHIESNDPRALWGSVKMPCLLVRCARPTGGAFFVPREDAVAFADATGAAVLEVDANHYAVMSHPQVAQAIRRFLA
jgi:pimeloyl-ACP methyl ester carboxylesterase